MIIGGLIGGRLIDVMDRRVLRLRSGTLIRRPLM
jgi:hypothetical protein